MIAHRLSTVLAADQILVLERGRPIDPAHRTSRPGCLHAALYERQFRTQPTATAGTGTDAAERVFVPAGPA